MAGPPAQGGRPGAVWQVARSPSGASSAPRRPVVGSGWSMACEPIGGIGDCHAETTTANAPTDPMVMIARTMDLTLTRTLPLEGGELYRVRG